MHELVIIETGHIDAGFKHEVLYYPYGGVYQHYNRHFPVTLCSLVTGYYGFESTYNTHLQGRNKPQQEKEISWIEEE